MTDEKKYSFNIINSKSFLSLSLSASKTSQNKKTKSIVITLFLLSSFFSLIYSQNFNVNNNYYANAATSFSSPLGQPLQKSQQDLQSAINKQVQQSFTNTIKSINDGKNNNASQINTNTTNSKNIQNNILITKILTKNLENHIQKAGIILEITSKLPQIRNISFTHLLNQTLNTLHGIPQEADIEKRQVAKNILSSNSYLYKIFFMMPNGDMYSEEPYSVQQTLTKNNYAFRDYFQGAIKTNDIYLGNVITTAAGSGVKESVIAVPVYSLKDNSTIVGVWAGSIDFDVLNKELQSLNLTSLDNITRVVYIDNNGQKVADSDINKSNTPESFTSINSFKNAINGQVGSTIDTVNNTKMMVTYHPVKVFHNTWVVLLIQPLQQQ